MKKDIAIQKTSTLMHPVPVPIKVMSQVGIDLMKMKETHDTYNYIISAIDYFTKFAEFKNSRMWEQQYVITLKNSQGGWMQYWKMHMMCRVAMNI